MSTIFEDALEEVGAVELADEGNYLVVSLTAAGVRLQLDGAADVGEAMELDPHQARQLYNVLGRAIEKAAKEGQ